jgi:hypothetical protein
MIKSIKAKELDKTEELYENLVNDFNKLAKESKSKFSMSLLIFPKLDKSILFGLGSSIPSIDIMYDKHESAFYFYGGIDEEIFKEVEPLVKQLKQEFMVELV